MNRFIVVVLDSFGVGAMDDAKDVRPQDIHANTARHLIEQSDTYPIVWDNFLNLGLMNALGYETKSFQFSKNCIYGTSDLKHFGADSFFGHQEIAGTDPKKPIFHTLEKFIEPIKRDLERNGHTVTYIYKDGLRMLEVDAMICIGDNMETDLGQAINVVGAMDYCGMDLIKEVGHIVRKHVLVPRVIAFGGSNVTIENIRGAIFTMDGKYIGVDAPKSGVYKTNYHVEHIGYGVDVSKQVSHTLSKNDVSSYFYGKVANIVYNPKGSSVDGVDTDEIFGNLLQDLSQDKPGFYFVNIQETDLAGHAQDSKKYIEILNKSDKWVGQILEALNQNDILVIMADHGNDPTIGHSKHTREKVPLLIGTAKTIQGPNYIGNRKTLSDVGQTVAQYFDTSIEHGTSFLDLI